MITRCGHVDALIDSGIWRDKNPPISVWGKFKVTISCGHVDRKIQDDKIKGGQNSHDYT